MTNQEIVDYVINTPNNTNPVILKQMLKDVAGSGNVELDTTLTQEGKAADAKAVGDAIGRISGGNPDWDQNDPTAADYVKNRPFWREVEKKAIPYIEYPISFTTTDVGNGFFMAQGEFFVLEDTVGYVVFDGVEYECEPHFDDFAGGIVIGASDFVAYPFCIVNGAIITKTAGEHTIEQYYYENVARAEYLPYLLIQTKKTEDKTPYIELEDVEKIKVAFKNGIPIRLDANVGGIGAYMQVLYVSESFIYASGLGVMARGTVEQVTYVFYVKDGTLHRSASYVLGSVNDNGNNYPVMYINNRYYKITIADDGTLTATEVTA